jgi:hypothetical protein
MLGQSSGERAVGKGQLGKKSEKYSPGRAAGEDSQDWTGRTGMRKTGRPEHDSMDRTVRT